MDIFAPLIDMLPGTGFFTSFANWIKIGFVIGIVLVISIIFRNFAIFGASISGLFGRRRAEDDQEVSTSHSLFSRFALIGVVIVAVLLAGGYALSSFKGFQSEQAQSASSDLIQTVHAKATQKDCHVEIPVAGSDPLRALISDAGTIHEPEFYVRYYVESGFLSGGKDGINEGETLTFWKTDEGTWEFKGIIAADLPGFMTKLSGLSCYDDYIRYAVEEEQEEVEDEAPEGTSTDEKKGMFSRWGGFIKSKLPGSDS